MDHTDGNTGEGQAYEHMYLQNLAVQDALVIIAIYASQLNLQPENREEISRIEAILEQCPVCVLEKEGIFSRIHKYVNSLQAMDPVRAVETAARTLRPNYREVAFELATRSASQDAPMKDDKKHALEVIAARLGENKQ